MVRYQSGGFCMAKKEFCSLISIQISQSRESGVPVGIFHLSTFLKSHIYRQNYQHYCHISTKLTTIICSFLYSYFMILKEVHCWKKHSPYAWLLLTRFEKSDLKWKFWSKNSPNFRKLDQKLDQNGRGSNLLTGNSLHKNKITVF